MVKKIKDVLFFNMKSFVLFEVCFKLASIFIFSPLFLELFRLIMKVTGFSYLTFENIVLFLTKPLTLFMLFLLIVGMCFYALFDITSIILIIDASVQKKKIEIREVVKKSLKKSIRVVYPKNIGISFLVLFLIPFLNVGIASSFISTISIPEFILDYVKSNPWCLGGFIFLVVLLFVLLLNSMYSLHYFVLEDKNFIESCKCSKKLNKKKKLKDMIVILGTQFALSFLYFIIVAIGIFFIFVINHFFSKIMVVNSVLISGIWIFIAITFAIYFILSAPISYTILNILFFKHKEEIQEKVYHEKLREKKSKKNTTRTWLVSKIVLGLCTIISGSIYTYGIISGRYNLNIEQFKNIEITAHRGASLEYPENTMIAFMKAKEMGADFIELDVQETKDGKIIVLHDKNLKRTTGLSKNTWEVTYEEIKDLDAGSFLNEKYSNARIPTLEEVVLWAKNNYMRLNIELKPTGHEKNLETSVIDILKENDFLESCVLASSVYSSLEKVKEIDERVETVYVMSLAYGDLSSFDKANHFSLEASNVSKKLLSRLHDAGSEVYAWTVNTEDGIQKMIDLNVDNIITDNIYLAKDLVTRSKTSNVIAEYIKFIETLF